MLGKCPTRIVSPKTETAVASESKIDNDKIDIFIRQRAILSEIRRNNQLPKIVAAAMPVRLGLTSTAAPPEFRCRRDSDRDTAKAGCRRRPCRNFRAKTRA